MLTLKTRHATVTVNPYGAQVMSFIPEGGTDVLWQTIPRNPRGSPDGQQCAQRRYPYLLALVSHTPDHA